MFLKACFASAVFLAFSSSALFGQHEPWDAAPFSADPKALLAAAATHPAEKYAPATMLVQERHFIVNAQGLMTTVNRNVYRIDDDAGVNGWATTGTQWAPWHQQKPVVRARVIQPDGTVVTLDPKTLSDSSVHQTQTDIYSDERRYVGPLPSVVRGAIVEEENTVADTASYFAGGVVERIELPIPAPILQSRIVIEHPANHPFKFATHLMPNAAITKTQSDGIERITIESGHLDAVTETIKDVPSDLYLYPTVEFATAESWGQVAVSYHTAISDKIALDQVKGFATVQGTNRADTIRKLVAKLHKNIRYTGLEFGESGLIPHEPKEVLAHGFGDCKDKAALLVAMLRVNHIPASLALLDAGPGLDVADDMPGVGLFDHAIVYVPAQGSDPELWIDATARYAQVGILPSMDYGRKALIIDARTTSLTSIPPLTAEANRHYEEREVFLSEYGPARVIETNQEFGPNDGAYREYYGADSKDIRKGDEQYVHDTYAATELSKLESKNLEDVDQPFLRILHVDKAPRGWTGLEEAHMWINPSDLIYRVPKELRDAEDKEEKKSDLPKIERTADWRIEPFTTEWKYIIHAPKGFSFDSFPQSRERDLGGTKLSEKYEKPNEVTLIAHFRYSTPNTRLTVAQGKELNKALVEFSSQDWIKVVALPTGTQLMRSGKVAEGLLPFRSAAQAKTATATEIARYSQALLTAGLGERARVVAREAVKRDPGSAVAQSNLGWVLEHDLVGRRFKLGFDRDGSIAAYLEAKRLEPDALEHRVQLGATYEYSTDAVRYHGDAKLEQAIAEWRELFKKHPEKEAEYKDYVLFDLWNLARYDELSAALESLPATEPRRHLIIATVAATKGADAALARAQKFNVDDSQRGKDIGQAAYDLMYRDLYLPAAGLFDISAQRYGNANGATLAALLRKTKTFEQLTADDSLPESAVMRLLVASTNPKITDDEIVALFCRDAAPAKDRHKLFEDFRNAALRLSQQRLFLAIGLASAKSTTEGDEHSTYRVSLQMGAQNQHYYVVKEDGKYRLAGVDKGIGEMGRRIDQLADVHDLETARKILDWLRGDIKANSGDDPLSGEIFTRFWKRGQEGDEAAIRRAAWSLVSNTKWAGFYRPQITAARNAATGAERTDLDLILAKCLAYDNLYSELLPVAQELNASNPDSETAQHYLALAYWQVGKPKEAIAFLEAHLAKQPQDEAAMRLLSRSYLISNDAAKARAITSKLMAEGKATNEDLNGFAWNALFASAPIQDDAIEAAQRANSSTSSKNYGVLHTLAALYVEQGKWKETVDLLSTAMDSNGLPQPDADLWYVYGRLAQRFGEAEAALAYYNRVTKPENDLPGSTYSLTTRHAAELKPAKS